MTAVPAPSTLLRTRPARRRALIRLFDLELRGRFTARTAKLAAILFTGGYALALPFAARGARDVGDLVVVRSLVWSSWLVAGLVAMAACGVGKSDDEVAFATLSRERGWNEASLSSARSLAVARRTLRLVLPSGALLALLALALSGSFATLGQRALLLPGVVLYGIVLAVSVALLVRVARMLSPLHPRTALAVLVFLPHVLRTVLSEMPSVPAFFHWMLTLLSAIGAPR